MSVNHYLKYEKFFNFGKRVQSQFVKLNPRNFYKISRYEYSDGDTKTMAGRESSLIFVIGVYDDKINCIKLNELRPEIFMGWLPTILKTDIIEDEVDGVKKFSELVVNSAMDGKQLFESKIKGRAIYNTIPRPYRTYNLDGLKYIQQIELKRDIIKTLI